MDGRVGPFGLNLAKVMEQCDCFYLLKNQQTNVPKNFVGFGLLANKCTFIRL